MHSQSSFLISIIGCIVGTLLTKPESDETLKKFYKMLDPGDSGNRFIKWWLQEDPSI